MSAISVSSLSFAVRIHAGTVVSPAFWRRGNGVRPKLSDIGLLRSLRSVSGCMIPLAYREEASLRATFVKPCTRLFGVWRNLRQFNLIDSRRTAGLTMLSIEISESSPRPSPISFFDIAVVTVCCAGLSTLYELHVACGATACRIIKDGWKPPWLELSDRRVLRGITVSSIHVAEMPFQLVENPMARRRRASYIVRRKPSISNCGLSHDFDDAYRVEQFADAFQCEIFRLHGIVTESDAVSALTVMSPSDGEQFEDQVVVVVHLFEQPLSTRSRSAC